MFKKSVLVVSLLAVALMMLVACGGAAAPTAAPATSAPAPTSAPPPTTAPAAPTTAPAAPTTAPAGAVIKAVAGKSVKMLMLPKFLGNAVFDQAHQGALEAAKELQNPADLQYLAPASGAPGTAQIEIVTNAVTQGVNAIMFDDNAGEQVTPAIQAARAKGISVVTWDSQIPSAQGEQVFVAQVDFDQTGKVMADMALDILGPNGGKFAILSASPDASNQNSWIAAMKKVLTTDPKYAKLTLLDTVYGNDQSEQSYNQALALVDKYPDMQLIMAPTTIGIAAAGKALTDNKLCDKVKVSGLGLPSENVAYVKNGCTPEFALWSFVDLGYLTYYTTYLVATGQMTPADGVSFVAGRMGTYTITKDPTRPNTNALRVLQGPFSVYNKDNIDAAVGAPPAAATQAPAGAPIKAVAGKSVKMLMLPKFLGNAVFDQAHQGALEAAKELQNPADLQYLAPASGAPGTAQIEIVTNAVTQGVNAIMFDDNAGEQVTPAIQAARAKGISVVTWDSQIPSAQGEQVFVAQVDFDQTGKVMADMALDILGPNGGKFAILSASPDASNQNSWIAAMKKVLTTDPKYAKLTLLDTVYGNDQSEQSYNQALALVDKYPDMQLIMAPTTIGIAAAGKALTDNKLCDKVKVSGLGLPSENVAYVKNGCTPEFALWSFVDLGYLTYYTTYLVATGQMTPADGVSFVAGRMGTYTITKDPTRPNTNALRVLQGPFSVYNKDNIDKAVGP